ncbi:MAG: hypothetical protein AB7I25_07165 [Vicinamibacterales bacterium]
MSTTNVLGVGSLSALVLVAAASCGGSLETSLERLSEAQRLSSDLLVQFSKSNDAGNRAVMAEADDATAAFVREAESAAQTVQQQADALGATLGALGYSAESGLLDEFRTRFATYRALDQTILDLAVEHTNLKAQRLSFGPAQQAVEAFDTALDGVTAAAGNDAWQARALAATALAAVREVQVLQAPHIAEAEDAAMDRLEARMRAAESEARAALGTLGGVLPPDARRPFTEAEAALNRFMTVQTELITLSRRNSDVRSLALSLGQRRQMAAACEETLRALQGTLVNRSLGGSR